MNTPIVFRAILALTLSSAQVFAQTWDPVKNASGWARVDKDGSVAFYDPGRRKVVSWMRDGGVLGEVNVSGLPQALWYWEIAQGNTGDDDVSGRPQQPEKWALDASFNAWVVTGHYLQFVGKDGKIANVKLPYEVGDLAWDAQGIYLSYQCAEPFIEKRAYDGGSVIWSYPGVTGKERPSPTVQNRIDVTEDKTVILSHPDNFQVDLIDGATGKIKGHATFMSKGKPAPGRTLGTQALGPMAWWLNKNTAFQAVPASQVPTLGMVGLLLAKEDFATSTMEFIPTGLSEKHFFIGIIDTDAAFIAPTGGLVFFPIHPN